MARLTGKQAQRFVEEAIHADAETRRKFDDLVGNNLPEVQSRSPAEYFAEYADQPDLAFNLANDLGIALPKAPNLHRPSK